MARERPVFLREQAWCMYGAIPYSLAYAMVEIPYILATSTLFIASFYWLVGMSLKLEKVAWYWIFFSLYLMAMVYVGHLLVLLFPSSSRAQVVASALTSLCNLFGGYLCSPPNISTVWK